MDHAQADLHILADITQKLIDHREEFRPLTEAATQIPFFEDKMAYHYRATPAEAGSGVRAHVKRSPRAYRRSSRNSGETPRRVIPREPVGDRGIHARNEADRDFQQVSSVAQAPSE